MAAALDSGSSSTPEDLPKGPESRVSSLRTLTFEGNTKRSIIPRAVELSDSGFSPQYYCAVDITILMSCYVQVSREYCTLIIASTLCFQWELGLTF